MLKGIFSCDIIEAYGGIMMQAVEFGAFVDNGVIEIPKIYRNEYSNNLRVILLKENTGIANNAPNVQDRIASAERLVGVASKDPLSLEEIRNERLARQ